VHLRKCALNGSFAQLDVVIDCGFLITNIPTEECVAQPLDEDRYGGRGNLENPIKNRS